jgi:tetraacyldisaccharide 4'-kinase
MPHSSSGPRSRPRADERLARRGGALELLRAPAWLYAGAMRARARAYELGLFARHAAGVPVVCAGNLSAGGTGKTPFVAWLVRELEQRGRRPGVLARGYAPRRVASSAAAARAHSDEGLLLEELLPGRLHLERADRVAGARALVAAGADAIVLDDGFQHLRLQRELDFVLVDALRPWGLPAPSAGEPAVRALLPRGLLREPPSALARAHALVLTRSDQVDPGALGELAAQLENWAPGLPIAHARHAPRAWLALEGERQPLEHLRGRALELVSGIGNPAAFEHSVRALGLEVATHWRFADHHDYGAHDLAPALASGRTLVCTHKDLVKWRALPRELFAGRACYALAVELELVAGAQAVGALLDAFCTAPPAPHARRGVLA